MFGLGIWFWVYYIVGWVIIFVCVAIYLWKLLKKPIADIIRRKGELWQKIGFVRLNKTQEKFTFGDKTYVVDWDKVCWIDDRGREHLFYLEGNAQPLVLANPDFEFKTVSADKVDLVLSKSAIKQLVEASKPSELLGNPYLLIAMILLGIGCGIAIGFALYPSVFPTPQPPTTTQPPIITPP